MIKIVEVRKTVKYINDMIFLAKEHRDECASKLPFVDDAIIRSFALLDDERASLNFWIAYKNEEPIGYGVGQCSKYFFNNDVIANATMMFVRKQYRGTYAYIKLMKNFEEWARINGALQIFAGIQRLEVDEAKHIRKLLPRLGYNWCGSNFVKETV